MNFSAQKTVNTVVAASEIQLIVEVFTASVIRNNTIGNMKLDACIHCTNV